jgi:hypothetical protein
MNGCCAQNVKKTGHCGVKQNYAYFCWTLKLKCGSTHRKLANWLKTGNWGLKSAQNRKIMSDKAQKMGSKLETGASGKYMNTWTFKIW